MNFKFLSGDLDWKTNGGKFISKKLNNGDFDYWMVLTVDNMNEIDNNPPYTYLVQLKAVSPSEAGEEELKSALECVGLEDRTDLTDLMKVEALTESGCSAPIWDDGGDNLKKLLKEAHKQASISETLFGFMMDKQVNRIGSNGWDFIKGDITAGLNRWKEANKES